MRKLTTLEKIKRIDGAYIYKDVDTSKLYRVTIKAAMPDVIMLKGEGLDKPAPHKIVFWYCVLILPLLVLTIRLSSVAIKVASGLVLAILVAVMLRNFLQTVSYSKHWEDCILEEIK